MSPYRLRAGLTCVWVLIVAGLGSCLLPAVSAEDLRETTSLKFAPADAAFYSNMLRNREQFEIFKASNAYQRLQNLPLVTFGLSILQGQWENSDRDEVRIAKEIWESDENQELVKVLLDAVSEEIFVYGDSSYIELAKLGQEFQKVMRTAQLNTARNRGRDEDGEKEFLKSAVVKLAQVKAPSTIVGFRVSDAKQVETQIARFEKHLGELFTHKPELEPLKERLVRKNIGNSSFLTFSLDGSLIPWDELPEETTERIDEETRAAIEKLKITVGLGVKDGYLLLVSGDSLDHVSRMGQGKLLVDRPELKPLSKHSDKRIVNVNYASAELLNQVNTNAGQLDDMVTTAQMLLPTAGLDEQEVEKIVADVRELATELKSFIPKLGAVSSFSFLTDRGFEGYSYNWGENKALEASQKLDILNHVGGNPIGFFAVRGKYSPDAYEWFVKWVRKAFNHGEKIAQQKTSDEDWKKYEQARDRFMPLAKRFDIATREHLMPALKDGQAAIVLDAKATSKQWHQQLPPTRVALPMLEIAMVYGVSDANALKKAASEYFEIVQAAFDIAGELAQGNVQRIQLPAPDVAKVNGSEIFSYAIPEAVGLDGQLAPNAGLSNNTLVLSLMPEMTKRLLSSNPPQGLDSLAKPDQPLASASYFNVAGLLDAISPWVNYGVRIAGQAQGEDNPQARMAMQMVAGNVTPIIDLLKCFGESASVVYIEDGVVVKHSATNFNDAR